METIVEQAVQHPIEILMTHPQITQVSRVTHLGVREDAIHEVPSTRVWVGCLGGGVGV
jgi:hypothetical protein